MTQGVCPGCQLALRFAAPVAEGRAVKCPKCGMVFRPVPPPAAAPAPPAPPVAVKAVPPPLPAVKPSPPPLPPSLPAAADGQRRPAGVNRLRIWIPVAAGGLLLLVGGVVAAVLLSRGAPPQVAEEKPPPKADDPSRGDDPPGKDSPRPRADDPPPSKEVAKLIEGLKDRDVAARIKAAESLGRLGPKAKPALPALFDAARDTGNRGAVLFMNQASSVTEAAVKAALTIDPDCADALARAALPDLIAALKSDDQAVLQAAGYSLAKLGPHARPALSALQDAQKRARGFAESAIHAALKGIGGEGLKFLTDVVQDPRAPLEKRLKALEELGWVKAPDERLIAMLTATLKDPEPRIRAGGAEALSSLGPKAKAAIPALLDRLGDVELDKASAAKWHGGEDVVPRALAHMGAEAVPGLVVVFQDARKTAFARHQAAEALAQMGRKARAARPALEAGLRDDFPPRALDAACAYVLAGGDAARALPVVQEGLKHPSTFVLWNAAHTAERLGPRVKEAVPDLARLLKHPDREVRIAAARALGAMGPAARPAVPAMAELLRTKDGRQRFQAAAALERLGPDAREALPVLIEQLNDLEKMSPHPILQTLGHIGPDAKPALPALLKLLRSGDDIFTNDVAAAIGQIDLAAAEGLPGLIARLDHADPSARAGAARALGLIGPEAKAAAPALTKRLEDPDKKVRVWAAFALARVADDGKTQLPYLVALWKEDRGTDGPLSGLTRFDLAQAFELLGAEARPARDLLLAALLDEKTPLGTHQCVARALGRLSDDSETVVPKLIELLERKGEGFDRAERCQHAADALGLLGPKARAAVPCLRRLLDDDDDDAVAVAAERALEKIEGK
jgi:HEAT repeat protein